MLVALSAMIFAICTGVLIVFQGCLAAGVPWGAASMGGTYPGKYPPGMRVVAAITIIVLTCISAIVLSHAGLLSTILPEFPNFAVWIVVGFFLVATIMNTITPSKVERIWAPVAAVQCITSGIIALS